MCFPTSRMKSRKRKSLNQSALLTTRAACAPSKSRNCSSCAFGRRGCVGCVRRRGAAVRRSCRWGRPPCPSLHQPVQSVVAAALPMHQHHHRDEVADMQGISCGIKPTYPVALPLARSSSNPGVMSCNMPRHFNSLIKSIGGKDNLWKGYSTSTSASSVMDRDPFNRMRWSMSAVAWQWAAASLYFEGQHVGVCFCCFIETGPTAQVQVQLKGKCQNLLMCSCCVLAQLGHVSQDAKRCPASGVSSTMRLKEVSAARMLDGLALYASSKCGCAWSLSIATGCCWARMIRRPSNTRIR